ncbi:Maf family protein [Gayadomonas joobiniege]|uniref:Maf family protein n=1 Tax=Gayadomonas joobiniege TaxID=1234606 RepID=UPI000377847C|nr:nucleoside triphosphate pyrophosphatase [Gayadomonas joobiniege]
MINQAKNQSDFKLVLASTSVFRKQVLDKLGLPFTTCKPQTDETVLPNEPPDELVQRLAAAKAQAGARLHSAAYVIGSDQVAWHNGEILGKPHNTDNALKQLRKLSGHSVTFYTGLSVISPQGEQKTLCEPFTVHFRQLSDEEILAYLAKEQPFNCAGSFKSEALGITLFNQLEGKDPNTLIGLPLISLCEILREFGVNPLLESSLTAESHS